MWLSQVSEVVGCADAEEGQATGQHRPGGFGEGEPGTVGGRGFLVAERQHGVLEGEERVGGGDEVPGEPVGGVLGRGGAQGVRVPGELPDENLCAGYVNGYVTGFAVEPQPGGATGERTGTRVGVPDPEEGVALALREVVGGDAGPVVGGGCNSAQRAASAPRGAGSSGAGTGRRVTASPART